MRMGKKGSWFSAIKRVFLPHSKDKLNNESDKRSDKEKKRGLISRHGETNSFFPLFRKASSIEKILGEAEREHNLIFRPPTPPEQPRTPPFVPHRPASPRVPSPRVASPRAASPRSASPRAASPPPPPQAASPRVASPRVASPRAASPSPPPRAASPQVASPRAAPPRVVHPRPEPTLRNQHASATQIQASYRGYKARRSFRALKGLVRLQGVVRGQHVERQTMNAMKHMQLLVRVQSQIQSRRIQINQARQQAQFKNDKAAESTLGNWISQASEANNENWDDSLITKEEREARMKRKEEAVIKRERVMAYTYSNQLWKATPGSSLAGVSKVQSSGFPWWFNRLDHHLPTVNAPESMKSFQLTPPKPNSEQKPSPRPKSSSSKQGQFTFDNITETHKPKSSNILPPRGMRTPPSGSRPRSNTAGSPFGLHLKDDSLISCPPFSVPSHMNPTVSTKAKARANSNPKERYVRTPRSESNRRLSYPFSKGMGSSEGSVSNLSVDSRLTTATNATEGRKSFNRFV